MPNGRTDIFGVETAKLLELLGLIQSDGPIRTWFDPGSETTGRSDDPIGTLFQSGTGTLVHVSLSDLCKNLLQHKEPRITIEEQHWCEYIIHIGKPEGGWVQMDRSSQAFPTVRRLHLDHRLPREHL